MEVQNPAEVCEFASNLILDALDGHNPTLIKSASTQLEDCTMCTGILDTQIKLREAMSLHLKTRTPSNLRIEISKNLKRVSLGDLNITDFPPPNFPPNFPRG